jgi:hypothetical protein
MTIDELLAVLRLADRYEADCLLLHEDRSVIVVGLDERREVALLQGNEEVPVRELIEPLR